MADPDLILPYLPYHIKLSPKSLKIDAKMSISHAVTPSVVKWCLVVFFCVDVRLNINNYYMDTSASWQEGSNPALC